MYIGMCMHVYIYIYIYDIRIEDAGHTCRLGSACNPQPTREASACVHPIRITKSLFTRFVPRVGWPGHPYIDW